MDHFRIATRTRGDFTEMILCLETIVVIISPEGKAEYHTSLIIETESRWADMLEAIKLCFSRSFG